MIAWIRHNFRQLPGLSALAAALITGGFSPLAFTQVAESVRTPVTNNRPCDYDINADCRSLLQSLKKEEVKTAQKTAPIDLTGYWKSVITEDWRWRVLTAPKGDYASLPLNLEGMRFADAWDESDAGSCKNFGAASLLRNPTRVRFAWDDGNSLRAETDNGEQTRIFHFGAATPAPEHAHELQGYSVASWNQTGLKVETTHLTAGYLRSNGVPYSKDARVTEYYDVYTAFDETWLTVTTIVEDPEYLTRTFNTSLDFKKLPDGSAWNPKPCDADE